MRPALHRSRNPWLAYVLALSAVAGATVLRTLLEPLLHGQTPYGLYYLSIVLVAWYGGTGPGLLAIASSLASALTFMVVRPDLRPDVASLSIFLAVAAVLFAMTRGARAAQESRSFSAAIVDSSDDAIITKSLDGIIESWNSGAERLFGFAAAEIIGRPVTTLIPPEHQAEETAILERLRRGERIQHFETVRLTKGGRRVDVSLTVSPVRDRSGAIIGASKIARDISERKRAAEEVAAERERLGRTLESIGDAVIATDGNGRIVFLNPVAERLTGWLTAEARGRSCNDIFRIINEDTRQEVESPVTRVLRLGTVVGLANHTVLIGKEGTERPIDDSGAPIRGTRGDVTGVVLVFRDISERRRVEAERRDAMTERERLLESERAARTEAEHANRSKDEFVATVSHELRNPLSAIMGWTRILKRNGANDVEKLQRGIDVIERNAQTQERLISDLLDMSRVISGKLRLDVRDIDLVAIIHAAVETTRPAADAKGISIESTLDPSVAMTSGDPTRLQQCVWNLLANAIKFTPQGGHVSINLRRSDSHVEIQVADTGVGIRHDFLPFVFERFRQAETLTSKRSGGLGLGLAIVKELVELHGGRVCVESRGEGQGAAFTIALPVHALRANDAARAERASQSDSNLEGLHVLVVEDDPDNREVLRQLLEQHRAAVSMSPSGRAALEMIPNVRPSILVSDIGLPEIDGYELIRRVRQLDPAAGGRIPAIALTAHASSNDRTKALRAGYQAHIAKPVEPRELIAAITSLADLMAARAGD